MDLIPIFGIDRQTAPILLSSRHYSGMTNAGNEIAKCERLLRHAAKKFAGLVPMDDLLQEGRIALLEAFAKWDPSIATLWTFGRFRVLKAMMTAATTELQEWRDREWNGASSRFAEGSVPDSSTDGYFGAAPSALSLDDEIALGQMLARLSSGERDVVRMYLVEDLSFEEIATRCGLTHERRACERFHEACAKLREQVAA